MARINQLEQEIRDAIGLYEGLQPDPSLRTAAEARFAPIREAALKRFGVQSKQLGAEFGDLEDRLREEATRRQSETEERFNQLGLLRSGVTAAGIGGVQRDLGRNLSRASIDKALKEADLVLQKSGFLNDLEGQIEGDVSRRFGQQKEAAGERINLLNQLLGLEERKAARAAGAGGAGSALTQALQGMLGGGGQSGPSTQVKPFAEMDDQEVLKFYLDLGYPQQQAMALAANTLRGIGRPGTTSVSAPTGFVGPVRPTPTRPQTPSQPVGGNLLQKINSFFGR